MDISDTCYSLFNLNLTQSDTSYSRDVYNLRNDVTVMYWCLIVLYLVTMLGFSNYRLGYKCIIYDVSLLVVTCFCIGDANKLWRDLNMNTYEYIFAYRNFYTLYRIWFPEYWLCRQKQQACSLSNKLTCNTLKLSNLYLGVDIII